MSRQRLLVALGIAAGVLAAIGLRGQPWSVTVAGAGLAGICCVLAIIDARTHRLPDPLVGLAYLVTGVPLALGALTGSVDEPSRIWSALLTGAACLAGYFLLGLVRVGGLGLGDVKLSGVLGLWLGWFAWEAALAAFIATVVLAGLWALVLVVARRASLRSHVALGPWMVVGAAVVTAMSVA